MGLDQDPLTVMQKAAYVYALFAVLLWSSVASAFKLTLRSLSVIELLLISNITSVFALLIIAMMTGKLKGLRSFGRVDILQSALFGLFNPFLYYLVLFSAYDLLPAQQAQAINYTWAITLSLLAVPILKQKLSQNDVLGLLIAYFGVLIISSQGNLTSFENTNLTGVAYALLSTLIWALYWVLNVRQNKEPICRLLLNFSFGLVFVLVYYFATADINPVSLKGVLGAVYIGIFEMSLTFYLWLNALRLSKNTARISTLIFLSPFLSLVFIHYLVGEDIKLATFAGLIVIIIGVLIQRKKKHE
jgi:drug/metabolite transporter (DMT)-like permease